MFVQPTPSPRISERARELSERIDQVVEDSLAADGKLKRSHIRQALRLVERKRCGAPAAAAFLAIGLLLLGLVVGAFVVLSREHLDGRLLHLLLPAGGLLLLFLIAGIVFSLRNKH